MTEPALAGRAHADALWAAVDRITLPTTRRVMRAADSDAVGETAAEITVQAESRRLIRHDLARYAMMTRTHGQIPCLWDQATDALTTGGEKQEGAAKQPYRTPCDLDLMETRSVIADKVTEQLENRRIHPNESVPSQMRQFAAHLVTHEPDHLEWWAFRFAQWARLLETYLQAVIAQPKPRRIRGTACPECQIRTVLVEDATGQMVNVAPIVIDFHDGLIRAAVCTGCGATLAFRGEEMWQLAERLDAQDQP